MPSLDHRPARSSVLWLAAASLVVGTSARLPAQDVPDSLGGLRRAVAATRPASLVRFELRDGRRVTGTLGAPRSDALDVGDSSGTLIGVRHADITRFWRHGRATRTGALIAGIPAGAFGALVGLAGHSLCEYDCHGTAVGSAVGGAVFVGALGAGVGAIIGAAIPRWRLAWKRGQRAPAPATPSPGPPVVTARPDPTALTARPHVGHVGEITTLLSAGYAGYGASSDHRADAGPAGGVSVGLGFRRGRLAFGPEAGARVGTIGTGWSLAAVGRLDLGRRGDGRLAPYVVAGAGATSWALAASRGDEGSGLFTGSLGVGATVKGRWRIEGRWHSVLQYSDPTKAYPTVITLGIGRLREW